MNTNLDPKTGVLTVSLDGDLVSTTADKLGGKMNALLDSASGGPAEWRIFRLELVTAKMVDSVGLNFIVHVLKAVQKKNARMQILYSNPNVHRTFLFTRLDKHAELVKA